MTSRRSLVEFTVYILLGTYLVATLAAAIAAAGGWLQVGPFGWAYSLVPAIAFGQGAWNVARSRRAGDPKAEEKQLTTGAIQTAIGVVLVLTMAYQWSQRPTTFTEM